MYQLILLALVAFGAALMLFASHTRSAEGAGRLGRRSEILSQNGTPGAGMARDEHVHTLKCGWRKAFCVGISSGYTIPRGMNQSFARGGIPNSRLRWRSTSRRLVDGVGGRASGVTNLASRTTLEKTEMLACAHLPVGVVSNP